MRTEFDRDSAASLSRRAFVVGAGSAVAASTMGSAAGADDDSTLTVAATQPYLAVIRNLVDAFERHADDVPVQIEETDGDAAVCVRDGSVDVHVSGRPVSTSSEGETHEDVADIVRGVAVHGWATLATRDDDWRECLSGSSLREALSGDSPVQAWSETDWESVETLRAKAADTEPGQCAGETAPDDDSTHIVRGTRAYQYALGHGGVSYYEVPGGDVGAPSTTRRQGDGVVPLIRLGHVALDADALDRATVGEFLRYYRRHSPTLDDLALHPGSAASGASALATA